MTDKSGGPAYPFNHVYRHPEGTIEDAKAYGYAEQGMSARLAIAAQLAAGLLAHGSHRNEWTVTWANDVFGLAEILIAEEAERAKRDAGVEGEPQCTIRDEGPQHGPRFAVDRGPDGNDRE
jgi:hypothetical protein